MEEKAKIFTLYPLEKSIEEERAESYITEFIEYVNKIDQAGKAFGHHSLSFLFMDALMCIMREISKGTINELEIKWLSERKWEYYEM